MKTTGLKTAILKEVRKNVYLVKVKIYKLDMYKIVCEGKVDIPKLVLSNKEEALYLLRECRIDAARQLMPENKRRQQKAEIRIEA